MVQSQMSDAGVRDYLLIQRRALLQEISLTEDLIEKTPAGKLLYYIRFCHAQRKARVEFIEKLCGMSN